MSLGIAQRRGANDLVVVEIDGREVVFYFDSGDDAQQFCDLLNSKCDTAQIRESQS